MNKSKGFKSILIPSATVFTSSGCIMVLELVAGRLIARHLGSSLYTWTSVIGVVLAGITIGNYLGGRIADRFSAKKALAVIFSVGSAACVCTIILNNFVGEWVVLWYLKWPIRVFTHVFLVFLVPSTVLGMISPVVAKMALDQGLPTGRTVGDIYAWGAAGSIAGTFLAGFYLIATMGTVAIIWAIGAFLLLMAIIYWARLWVLYVWAAIFVTLMVMGMAPIERAARKGESLGIREKTDANILYEDESRYNYIVVRRLSAEPDKREFVQDTLTHSMVVMDDIENLEYSYAQIYAAITHKLSTGKNRLTALIMGGGGFVFPRYIEAMWPGSGIDVAEIDPGVIDAAKKAFGLEQDTKINIFTMDARNYVDELLRRMLNGQKIERYDFIYGDTINDYQVPYQLVTLEFNEKIARILAEDGVYMLNLIDTYASGRFLGSIIKTVEQTFPHVYVLAEVVPPALRNTFVVVASKREINLDGLVNECRKEIDIWHLKDSQMDTLRSRGIVLTDDYVPTETMLAAVVQQNTVNVLTFKLRQAAKAFKQQNRMDKSIAIYKELIKLNPAASVALYSETAKLLEQNGQLKEAVEMLGRAIELNEHSEMQINITGVRLDLALLLKALKRQQEAQEQFAEAIEGLEDELEHNPRSTDTLIELGAALVEVGRINEATSHLEKAVEIDPFSNKSYLMLAQTLLMQKRYDEAIGRLREGVQLMTSRGRNNAASELQRFIDSIESDRIKQS
jgi:spermidine synthase